MKHHHQTLLSSLTRLSLIGSRLSIAILGAEVRELDKVGNDANAFLSEYHDFITILKSYGVSDLYMHWKEQKRLRLFQACVKNVAEAGLRAGTPWHSRFLVLR